MALLSKKKQIVASTEAVSGTTPSGGLTDANNADILLDSAEPSFEIDYIDREFLRDTLTKIKSIPGQKTGGIAMSFELSGNSTDTFASGVPAWGRMLEYSGFRQAVIGRFHISTTFTTKDGPIRHGEQIIIVPSSGTTVYATVVSDVLEGDEYIYYEDSVNAAGAATAPVTTAGVVTAQDSGVVVSTDTAAGALHSGGWAWVPVTESTKTATCDDIGSALSVGAVYKAASSGVTNTGPVYVITKAAVDSLGSPAPVVFRAGSPALVAGESIVRQSGTGPLSMLFTTPAEAFEDWPSASIRLNEDGVASDFVGSRCNSTFEFEVNRPIKVNVTSRGRWSASADEAFLSSTAELIDPKLWAGGVTTLSPNENAGVGDGREALAFDRTACVKTISLDMGVTLADVKCAEATDGLQEIIGSERSASGSMTANATNEADIAWLGAFRTGEVNRMRVEVGATTAGFRFNIPSAQTTGASTGDEDGIMTRQIDFSMNAGVIDNSDGTFTNNDVYSTRGDNEMVLIYSVTS